MRYSRSKEWGVLRNIFLTERFSDCVILVENEGRQEARFPCHRSVLIMASKYFETTLSSGKEVEKLTFTEVRPHVVMAFLEFVYFGWVALEGWEFMLELYNFSVVYCTPDLAHFCEASIRREINSTNICSIFESSTFAKSVNLILYCRDNFVRIGFLGLNRKAFRECSPETVTQILSIFMHEERNTMVYFKILWEWCAYNCCKEAAFLTEETIASLMRPQFCYFLRLEELSKEELHSLPKRVVEKYSKEFPRQKLGEREHDTTSKETVPDWREHAFLSEDFCDCAVFVKTSNSCFRFPCNRKILSDASRVFAELFQNVPQEEKNTAINIWMFRGSPPPMKLCYEITVDDISPSTMYTILMHVYINKVEFKGLKSVCEIYVTAHRYKLINLIPHCHEYMNRIITTKNICTLIECAVSTGSRELLEICEDFIWGNDISDIMNSRGFQEMSPATLSIVLEMPCFNLRFEWLEFGVLWKRGIACCCENKTLVTHENIWNEISPLSEYIDFNNLSDEEMQCIPESERQKLRQRCLKSRRKFHIQIERINVSSISLSEDNEEANVAIDAPLSQHTKTFKTTSRCFNEIVLKGHFILFQFSLNKNAFLPTLSIFHLGNPMFSALKSVRICKRNETTALYRREKDDDLKATQIDCPDETEIVFRAVKDLYIEANKVHTVEVNYGDSSDCLVWPLVSLLNNSDGELEVTISSEKCYGLRFLSFSSDL